MALIVSWIIFSILVGILWSSKKRSFAGGFFLSLLLSPLTGFIIGLLIKPNVEKLEEERIKEGAMKKCPYCAEIIKLEAKVCRYCGRELQTEVTGSAVIKEEGGKYRCPYCGVILTSANDVKCWYCHKSLWRIDA